MKPSLQFLEKVVDDPDKIFNSVITRETNRRSGKKPLNYYFSQTNDNNDLEYESEDDNESHVSLIPPRSKEEYNMNDYSDEEEECNIRIDMNDDNNKDVKMNHTLDFLGVDYSEFKNEKTQNKKKTKTKTKTKPKFDGFKEEPVYDNKQGGFVIDIDFNSNINKKDTFKKNKPKKKRKIIVKEEPQFKKKNGGFTLDDI